MTHAADGDARMPLRKEKQQYVGMLYCLPYVVVFLMGTILPILYALYLSFSSRNGWSAAHNSSVSRISSAL